MKNPLNTSCPTCSQPWPPAPVEHAAPFGPVCSYCEQPWPAARPEPEAPPQGCSDCGEPIAANEGRDTCPTCALAEYSRTGSRVPLCPEPKPAPALSERMKRIARLLHYGALPLWDGWAHSRGRMDPVPEGALVYSRSMQSCDGWPDNVEGPVLEIFKARPRIRKVVGVYDAMTLREHTRDMRGGEPALDHALALLESGELS